MPGSDDCALSKAYVRAEKERRYVRSRITRIYNQVEQGCDDMSVRRKTDFVEKLTLLQTEINEANKNCSINAPDSLDEESVLDAEETYNDNIYYALNKLKSGIPDDNIPLNVSNEGFVSMPLSNKLKLPVICMPEFSNSKSDNLEKFFHSFESIVDRQNLSSYEKFVYLQGQLRNAPKILIDSLDSNDQTYERAKDLLSEAFASPLTQKYTVIKRLSKLKLSYSDDPYVFIGEFRSILSSIRTLDINLDDVVQFFLWTGLNDLFQNQLVQITNCNKPSLTQINENLFVATERFVKINDTSSSKKSYPDTKNYNRVEKIYAMNVKKNFYPCNLCLADGCENVSHKMSECTQYGTPVAKVDKLKQLNYCSRCSFSNHKTADCKYKFSSKCKHCSSNHMSYLCVRKSTHSNVSFTNFLNINCVKDEVLLPSFAAEIRNVNKTKTVRILKDSGSQRNFINGKLIGDMNFTVIEENINIEIRGFNVVRSIMTNLVRIPLTVDDYEFHVEAIVVPDLSISLEIPNVRTVVEHFISKGYKLADYLLARDFSNKLDFDLVIGTEADQILETNTLLFGERNEACCLRSRFGILLSGKVQNILDNISYLPNLHSNVVSDSKKLDIASTSECVHSMTVVSSMPVEEINYLGIQNLDNANDDILNDCVDKILSYDSSESENDSDEDQRVIDGIISSIEKSSDGRFRVSLPWNRRTEYLLGRNFLLSKNILHSNLKNLKKHDLLVAYDKVFKEQEGIGIIERITDIDGFISKHPNCSFLPHMGVYKPDRETTKIRIVYLSNLCEKNDEYPNAVSHNQALLPGPCLNSKLSTTILFSRFNKYILTFDIAKAFLAISLPEKDQNRLMCLWFEDIEQNNFNLIAYRNKRLSFGLRPSPAILMMTLYKLLIIDVESESDKLIDLKKLIYHLIYMDNGCVTANDPEYLKWAFEKLQDIFDAGKFSLQQFQTNYQSLQSQFDTNDVISNNVKYFGMVYNKTKDTLSNNILNLNSEACSKRQILSTMNAVFDVFGIYAPILNRAKLFIQRLQRDKSLTWDSVISEELQKEWKNISRQANATPEIVIPRYVGRHNDQFELVGYSDASACIYGAVVYLVNKKEGIVSFLCAKNRVVNNSFSKKTIPSLEFQAITYAVQLLIELFQEITGPKVVLPVQITKISLYTDSMVCLSWIKSHFETHDKMNKKSTFIRNRLDQIDKLCYVHPVSFHFIEGKENPADLVSRQTSYKMISKSNFYSGPTYLIEENIQSDISVIADGCIQPEERCPVVVMTAVVPSHVSVDHLVEPESKSRLGELVRITSLVLKFVSILKERLAARKNLKVKDRISNYEKLAFKNLIRVEQRRIFPDVCRCLETREIKPSKTPNLILQMNLFLEDGIIKVMGKFANGKRPILLPSKSYLTKLIIRDMHEKLSHAGLFITLKELRKQFWILKGFSTVKINLKECIACKRLNEKPIQINQSFYRDARTNPPSVPFSYIYFDHMGPFYVFLNKAKVKVWILVITCMWSRAISLKLCYSLNVAEFLRTLQLHVYDYGIFSYCVSDLGSQLVAGAKIIAKFLSEEKTKNYFQENGIKEIDFQNYAKGNSSLGGLIENSVKQTKHLLLKSIHKSVLEFTDFELFVSKVNHIINKRPVAFKESVRSCCAELILPEPISPEMLIKGYEVRSINIIPQLDADIEELSDENFEVPENESGFIQRNFQKLKKINARLVSLYNEEFLRTLMEQSVDKRDRYTPKQHKMLGKGDVVLLIESNMKQHNYPLGIVREVETNRLGEVTAARVFKGSTRETVYRHSTSLIRLIQNSFDEESDISLPQKDDTIRVRPPKRRAFNAAQRKINKISADALL